VPLQWAATQTALGTALETLGERESGTGRLNRPLLPIVRRSRNSRGLGCRSNGRRPRLLLAVRSGRSRYERAARLIWRRR
jgi:hypothetical protein